jgi:hypothetical protein
VCRGAIRGLPGITREAIEMIKINIVDENGKLWTDDYGQVHLKAGRGERIIGRILDDQACGNRVYFKSESLKEVFKKNNSWSLCYELINQLADNDIVNIKTRETGAIVWLTIKEVKEKGDFLWFKKTGIEKKLYIPLDQWHKEGEKIGGVL